MRFEQRDGEPGIRPIGAAVVRPAGAGIVIDFGPADGPPLIRLALSKSEATQLSAALRGVLGGRDEEIILVEES